jgi:hypothetical protein
LITAGPYSIGEEAILSALAPIVLHHRPGPLVDIGIGMSTQWLAHFGQVFDVPLLSCDIAKEHEPLYPYHYHFICSSYEFMDVFLPDEVAIVHIDGCHDAQVVFDEVHFFYERLIPGGIIFMHDTYPPSAEHLHEKACSDSFRVRRTLENDIRFPDVFTWQYSACNCGLTMITKREADRSYYQW